jgi:hypothetical protein
MGSQEALEREADRQKTLERKDKINKLKNELQVTNCMRTVCQGACAVCQGACFTNPGERRDGQIVMFARVALQAKEERKLKYRKFLAEQEQLRHKVPVCVDESRATMLLSILPQTDTHLDMTYMNASSCLPLLTQSYMHHVMYCQAACL